MEHSATDEELFAQGSAGDRRAFDTLVARHLDSLLRFARHRCSTSRGAQEAVAQGLATAWEKLGGKRAAAPRMWLFQLVVEACREEAHDAAPSTPEGAPLLLVACSSIQALLSARLDGDLTAAQDAEVERHLAVCPTCAQAQRELRAVHDSLHNLEHR